MKFGPDSDECACGHGMRLDGISVEVACMRTAGHEGEHIAMVGDAATADGVQFCCRIPLGATEHKSYCFRTKCSNIVDDDGRVCSLPVDHEGPCDPFAYGRDWNNLDE